MNSSVQISLSNLAAGSYDVIAAYNGDTYHAPSLSNVVVQVVQPLPTAINDAAGALENHPVTSRVLANDLDPAGGGLTVTQVGQPVHGAAQIAAGNQGVTYTPDPGYNGVDSFTYTATDMNGATDDALVTVVVAPASQADTPEQVATTNPSLTGTAHFTSAVATVAVALPARFYTGLLTDKDALFVSYTPIVTPTEHTQNPPGNLKFGNLEFDMGLYLNDQHLDGYQFAVPLTMTISYAPALLEDLDEASLTLSYWDGKQWSASGIEVLRLDLVNHVLIVSLAHFSDYAFFVEAPGGAHLYLPGLYRVEEGANAAPQRTPAPRASPFAAPEQIFLPQMQR
ncbi:MAG: cadherin-like domain-containing protein [Anaerolineales bacterium]|nr:cadherin-like domain-containing protein [Anaerolineales bacterium]